ncbi:unnamed protein product [Meloidogyne enterolobii]|uniref:Uncharacterized protein n=1 Tax=Meloidogyne enterolobii TaxID=390850 RepID=A0ACB1B1D6_MELEN
MGLNTLKNLLNKFPFNKYPWNHKIEKMTKKKEEKLCKKWNINDGTLYKFWCIIYKCDGEKI